MNKIKLIEKIEGEAKLHFSFKNKKIDFVEIEFLQTRSIEKILEGKNVLDALVINPRVCGICGHAHLIATVEAIEDCYESIEISDKAKIIRELTLNFELIQNHFKWFYFTVLPLFGYKQAVLKAALPSQIMSKAIAVIAGQYPHNSYALPGGVVCDITNMDVMKVSQYIRETQKFFENNIIDINEDILECTNIDKLFNQKGDLSQILDDIIKNSWEHLGKSYDRFIAFGENSYFTKGKSLKTRRFTNISLDEVKEFSSKNSYAKNVTFKDKYFEVGPLSRTIIKKTPLIKDSHNKYDDSIVSRIVARVLEIPQLLKHSQELIKQINLDEPSYIKPKIDISKITSTGNSAVEAARGSLIHKVDIENGIIKKYEIITPTQWNLSNGTRENQGISQHAMIGLQDEKIAEIVFKSFDVCSVCTTH
ncbi:nickel-dependent hydrogenase large subunit [Arcobacter sp. 15-2]|uniref:nickel-dependent hydrogenase large subunit n=1 Tax=Arcobacter sp. 15-2 TaxID=3374109 RepID=UPI00399C7183